MIMRGPETGRRSAMVREATAPARGGQRWINPRSDHSIEIWERVVKEHNARAIRILFAASPVPIRGAIEAAACLEAALAAAASEEAAAGDADDCSSVLMPAIQLAGYENSAPLE